MEKKKKITKFTICTADSKYVKDLLQHLIKENSGWEETLLREKYDLRWFGSKVEDTELIDALKISSHMANRIPGIYGLAFKDMYIKLMKVASHIDKEMVDSFVPQQFTFPQDRELFLEYHKIVKGSQIFIAKPVASSEGNSILLFKDLSEVPSMLGAEMVVQRYIHNPLLIDDLKFDLRVYVVLVGTYPHLSAYICNEGLARFCTEKYEKPTRENFKRFYMHLTNYSINKHSESYVECENILEPNNATKRTLTSLMQTLQSQGVDIEKLKINIKVTCEKAMSTYGSIIEHHLGVATNLKKLDGSFFQILGFDILADEDLNCYLLEINDHPSLDIYLEKDFMGGGMGKSLSQIDLYVKKIVLGDAIKITKKLKKHTDVQIFRSLERIAPIIDESSQAFTVYQTLTEVRNLYNTLAPVKHKHSLTSSNFESLYSKSSYLVNSPISKIDMSLLFIKVSETQRFIDFIQFFWLLVKLQETICFTGEEQIEHIRRFIERIVRLS